jgi:hypothetical protein
MEPMEQELKDMLAQKLNECPLFSRYLSKSLLQRAEMYNWFENRFIRSMIRNSDWVNEHEELFNEAKIEEVKNSDHIFNSLSGDDPDYDLKIFDALTEVRFIKWAKQNQYTDIEKITTCSEPTPDFQMKKNSNIIFAEAKHFRERDYLLDFVEDWLSGLVLKTGLLKNFGFSISTSDKYNKERQAILEARKPCETKYREIIREELSEEWLKKIEEYFVKEPDGEIKILDELFIISKSNLPQDTGVVRLCVGISPVTVMWDKIKGDVKKALLQINSYVSKYNIDKTNATAIVFLSGADPSSLEWSDFWEALSTDNDNELISSVKQFHDESQTLISLPFWLIIGKDNPLKYAPFPWPA